MIGERINKARDDLDFEDLKLVTTVMDDTVLIPVGLSPFAISNSVCLLVSEHDEE